MRILHVNKFLYRRGGAEGYMLDLAEIQRRRGDEIAFFGMDHPDNGPQRYSPHFPRHVELEPPPPSLRGRAAATGRMMWSTSARRGMARAIDDFRPDVVHMHNIYHQLSPSIVRAVRRAGVPAVMTLHDYKLVCPSYQMLCRGEVCDVCISKGLHAALSRRCKDDSFGATAVVVAETGLHRLIGAYDDIGAFVSPSRFLAATLARAKVQSGRVHVVNHFVDLTDMPAKERPGGPVVFFGRLSAEKGVRTLLAALERTRPGTRLEIAGDGPERAALEDTASRTPGDRVRFHGRLGKEALLRLVRSASVVAVPSEWHENQPMAVLEAFACGVPVVTTDLGGLPELVTPGVDGLVVPARDSGALAAALDEVTAQPDLALEMGRAGRRKIEERFQPAEHLQRLDRVYAASGAALASSGGGRVWRRERLVAQ